MPPPKPRRFRSPGRKRRDDRQGLTGILFVLKTGIPWEELPQELGCGWGRTCLNRLQEWHRAGVGQRLHQLLLSERRAADQIDGSRATVDASFARAPGGGEETGPPPTDRGKPGSKHQVLTDAQGIPLAAQTTAANVNEGTQLLPLVDAVPPVAGQPGHPRQRPESLYGDRAYDSEPKREERRQRGIEPFLPKQRAEQGSGRGVFRWVAERTLSWLHGFRKRRLRTDWQGEIHDAFLALGCCVICFRFL